MKEFKVIMEKFVISFLLSSEFAKRTSNKEGYVLPTEFEHQMNKILSLMVNLIEVGNGEI